MDRDQLVQALIVVVIANTLVIGLALAGSWSRRRRAPVEPPAAAAVPLAPRPAVTLASAAPAASATLPAPGPVPSLPVPAETVSGAAPVHRGPPRGEHTRPTWDEIAALAGLHGPVGWHDAVVREGHRLLRSGGRLAVVALEARGYRAVEERFGAAAGGPLAGSLARTVRELSRQADVVACIGPASFRFLLLDADQSGALRCIERLAAAADPWLTAGGLDVRLAAGAATVPSEADLSDAIRLAEERMHRDGRRPGLVA